MNHHHNAVNKSLNPTLPGMVTGSARASHCVNSNLGNVSEGREESSTKRITTKSPQMFPKSPQRFSQVLKLIQTIVRKHIKLLFHVEQGI
jgi:hypothetical protein